MNLEKMSKNDWNLEHADAYPIFAEMTGSGFTSNLYNAGVPGYSICPCYYNNGTVDWTSLISDQQKIGGSLINQFIRHPEKIRKLYKKWLKNYHLMMCRYLQLFQEDLHQLNNRKLLDWEKNLYNFYRYKISMPGFIDGFMFYADKRFDFLLREYCLRHKIQDYTKIFSILSAATESSFINQEEMDLEKLMSKITKNSIAKHLLKYSWIKSSYAGYREYTEKNLKKEIVRIKISEKIDKKIFIKRKKDKNAIIKKYCFTPEILAIARLTEILIKWQDLRKEYTLTYVTLQDKLLKEVANRANVNFELLCYCQAKEIPLILNKKFDLKKLRLRQKGCIFVYEHGEIMDIITDEMARKFFKQISRVKIDNIKDVRGLTASLGHASGTVKIIFSINDIHKIKQGDILVASMTRPEHLPAMRLAQAIVTDDGGITCHAAIVSRELGIPCVIGTKIATKVLKDGDMVDVDANNGIVKIIKRA